MHNIGRGQTHKAKIIGLYLDGMTYIEIKLRTKHSVGAIKRYLEGFTKILMARKQGKGKSEDGKSKTREAKLGCIFTETKLDENNRPIREESSTTYVGKIEKAEDFGKRINAEAIRRGIKSV